MISTKKKECPYCGSKNIKASGDVLILMPRDRGIMRVPHLCLNCGRSFEIIFKR
jgi:DNA-directed RNA polymerase subunit RPC12/RpoP